MNPESVSFWADVAAIFILSQLLLFTLLTAVGLGMGWWYFRQGRKKLVMPMLMAQVYALRVQQGTQKASNKIAAVPIGINTTVKRAQVTALTLFRSKGAQKENDESTTGKE